MTSQAIESHRNGAEVYHGDTICKQKSCELLSELGLPKGLFPMEDIEEFGYNRSTGFLWLLQKKKKDHTFKAIKQLASYGTEVTAIVEPHKITKLTGVKTKELFLWLSVVEIYIQDPASGKITLKTGTGLSETYPVSAFELPQ